MLHVHLHMYPKTHLNSTKPSFIIVSLVCYDVCLSPVQQQAMQRPRIKDEDVTRLQEMFPTLDTDVVRSVLEANHGVVDSAVTALLQMTET